MPHPRSQQISLVDTAYYHCVSRCVRRAYLCGKDKHTGVSYEHRRGWVEQRLLLLASVFCIDVCAYAVMSNHTHLVLHVNKAQAATLTDREVIARWHQVFRGTLLTQQYMAEHNAEVAPWLRAEVARIAAVYRQRLYDISWFMRCLNEHIAREANREDDCTGRFWEGRFKSQALLDEAALAACMAYVDLNPMRAGMAASIEASAFTSVHRRLRQVKNSTQPHQLMPFSEPPRSAQKAPATPELPFTFPAYLSLITTTARRLQPQAGSRPEPAASSSLSQLGLNAHQWHTLTTQLEQHFHYAIGREKVMRLFGFHTERVFVCGTSAAKKFLKEG